MAITPLPTPPSRDDPTNFATRADAFLGALPDFATEANALQVDVNAKQVTATTQAGIATTQAGIATTQAGIATTQAGLAADQVVLAAAQVDLAEDQVALAEAQAIAAAASAASAAALAGAFVGTSASSLSIGIGNKVFTTQSGEQYTPGIWMTAVSQADASNFMFGQVVSYSGTTLTLNVQSTGGSGTFADWNLSLAGVRGAPGAGITEQSVGWIASGGTSSRTLTVDRSVSTSGLQDTLVSGTNVKTVNGASVLGSGDIVIPTGTQFDFVADGAITQGKAVILKSNGKVAQSAIASASVGTNLNSSGNFASAVSTCYDPVNDKFVVFYCDTTDGNKGKAIVGTVSGSTVSFGTPVVFYNAALYTGSTNGIDSCYDEDTGQIIVVYSPSSDTIGRAKTCSVSGTTVSFGSELSTGQLAYDLGVCYDTSVNRVLFAYRSGSAQLASVISVSGTSLSLGATDTAYGSNVNGYTSSVVHCQGHGTVGTNAICFNTGGQAYITIAKIDPSTFALSFAGTQSVGYGDGYAYGKTLAWSSAYQRLTVLRDGGPSVGYDLRTVTFSVSASAFTFVVLATVDNSGSYSAPYQNFPSIACSPDGLSICVAFPDAGSSYYGKIKFSSTFTASSLGFGSEIQFQTSDVGWTSVAYNASGKVLVGYSVTSGFGKAVIGTAPIPDQRTSFIGFAQSTVSSGQTVTVSTPMGLDANQSGLTPNTNYFLSNSDGTTLTTTVNGPRVAKALSATKVLVLGSNVYQV